MNRTLLAASLLLTMGSIADARPRGTIVLRTTTDAATHVRLHAAHHRDVVADLAGVPVAVEVEAGVPYEVSASWSPDWSLAFATPLVAPAWGVVVAVVHPAERGEPRLEHSLEPRRPASIAPGNRAGARDPVVPLRRLVASLETVLPRGALWRRSRPVAAIELSCDDCITILPQWVKQPVPAPTTPPPVTVRGLVTDEDGAGVANATVTAIGRPPVVTDADGRFVVDLPPGVFDVDVTFGGGRRSYFTRRDDAIQPGTSALELRLPCRHAACAAAIERAPTDAVALAADTSVADVLVGDDDAQ